MEIQETLKNGNVVNITTTLGSVVTKVNNQGTDDEFKSFSFSGYTKINKHTKIGTMSISTPDSTKRFSKSPNVNPKLINRQLGLGSYLKTKQTGTTRDSNGNITSYLFDLTYVGKEKVSKAKALKYKIVDPVSTIRTRDVGVTRLVCGNYVVSNAGERRKITIQGAPDSEFEIAINKLTDSKDSITDNIISTSDSSILLKPNSTGNISTQKTLKEKIGKNGTYSFYQTFPKNIITENANSPQRYSIDIKTSSVNINNFNINNFLTNRTNWEGWYSKILNQYINPTITLRPTTDISSGATISVNGGTAVNFRSTTPTAYDLKYKGYYGRTKDNISDVYSISYVMVAASGTWISKGTSAGGAVSFVSIGPNDFGSTQSTHNNLGSPIFSNTDQSQSDWTFSNPQHNGGTLVDISNIQTSGVGTNTFTITFNFSISRFGTKNVTMSLATNYIVYNA